MRSLKFATAIILGFAVSAAGAQTFNLSIVQNEKAPAIAIELSRVVEDEILGQCFNAGLIISNDEIRFNGSDFSDKKFGIKQAAFGMSDYLLAVLLVYGKNEKKIEKSLTYAELEKIQWRLVKVSDSSVIAEKTIKASSIPVQDSDPYNQARVIARSITSETTELVRNSGKKEKQ